MLTVLSYYTTKCKHYCWSAFWLDSLH